ncbi:MAG: translocation/assembly module TamB domain-containing protein [Sulfitobacter sp.]
MRVLRVFLAASALWFVSLITGIAQEDDKGFLTRTLQDALSGAGRAVSIDGFEGALSSSARFSRMTIADAEGIWLTLEGVKLEWNRSALLRGRLEVEKLTAAALDIPRLPNAEGEALPDAEAAPFRLPELPVSIEVREFAIQQINLGAPLLGEAAHLSVSASAIFNDTLADIDLLASRTDGKRGSFAIKGNYARSDNLLDLLVDLSEGDEGIAARVLSIPGQPDIDLQVQGSGPLDAFVADVKVASEGQERLTGQVELSSQTPRRASSTPDRRVKADIGGDITALLAPRYRAFFGEEVALKVDALLESNGAIELSTFALNAQAANLEGTLALNPEGWPTLIDITGRIANPDGTPILLPVGGEGTTVQDVTLRVDYNAAGGNAIDADFDVLGFALAGLAIDETTVALDGTLDGGAGSIAAFLGDIRFGASGLAITDQAVAEAVGDAVTGTARITYAEGQPTEVQGLSLAGADYALTGDAVISGLESGFETVLDAALQADDLSRFSALAGRELDGQSALGLEGKVVPLSGQFDLAVRGMTQDLRIGVPQADAVLAGRTELSVNAKRDETGTFLRDLTLENAALDLKGRAALRSEDSDVVATFRLQDVGLVVPQYDGPMTVTAKATQDARGWTVDAVTDGPYKAALTAQGLVTGPDASLDFTADVPNVKPFADQIDGPVTAKGTVWQTPEGWQIETNATGPYRIKAALAGVVTPDLNLDFDLAVPDVQPIVPQLNGPLTATGNLLQTAQGFRVSTRVTGPYASTARVEGLATGPDMNLSFEFALPQVNPLVPGISGPLSANGVVRQTAIGIALETTAAGPYSASASVRGIVTGPAANVDFRLEMPNIGAIVPQVNGPLKATGNARKDGSGWQVTSDAVGPSSTQVTLGGLVRADGTLNLNVGGSAPLGLSAPFLAPRDLQGQATFDLQVNGPARLSSVTGRVQTAGATFSAPNLRVALQNIAADVRLANSRAQLDVTGQGSNGGQVRAAGSVALTSSLAADIQVGLDTLVLIDPRLYRTSLGGAVRVAGPLRGGARITGQIDVGETTVNVPSTGLTTIGDIPAINHIGATRPVLSTRRKAGLDTAAEQATTASDRGPGFGLDLRVSAPNRIFVRGRGLDAELGGALRLTGSTNRIISAGRFDLLRGRLNILAQRFDLEEGAIQFQGDLVPYIRFVSVTEAQAGEVRVIVEGPADAPEVKFESTPEAPQDEVLAQLLFGRSISEISAFQALQLANAVASLAGREGIGVISNLREGFGLDDLDVTTTDSGATAVRAGKYISENVYTDVTAASDGTGEVSLNLDITSNLKGKATLGSDGNSGIGIFFEKDY